jgi:hypothetical protein
MSRWRKLFLSALLAGLIAVLFVLYVNREVPIVARPIVTVETHLVDNARDFFARNEIDPASKTKMESGKPYSDTGILAFTAFASRPDDPEGYVFRYKSVDCEMTLPAGRYVQIDHRAGFFTVMSSTLPLEPVSFEEIMALSRQIGGGFDTAGWKRIRYKADLNQETFGENSLGGKFEYFGTWQLCNDPAFTASIKIMYYNSLPSAPSIPPVAGKPLPKDRPDRYLVEVMFDSPDTDILNEAIRLRDARRIAVNGDKDKPLTLELWVNEPDWRPEGWQGRFIK